MKEKFTQAEWLTLRPMPIQAFLLVAGIDGKIDEKETEEFADRCSRGAAGYKDPLHREIAQDLASGGFQAALEAAVKTDPGEVKRILRKNLTGEEYERFVSSVFIDCLAVAAASGPRFRKKKRIGDAEGKALAAIAAVWEVNLDGLVSSRA